MSRTGTAGRFAKANQDEYGGEVPVVIDQIGHFANLSSGSLRELQTELRGAGVWKEMYEIAAFTASKVDADAHGLKLKPLEGGRSANTTGKRGDEKGAANSAEGGGERGATGQAKGTTTAGKSAAKPGPPRRAARSRCTSPRPAQA